jgi:hypothetical protein
LSTYTYPQDVYDKPANLLALLGSWWAEQYAGSEQMAAVVEAMSATQQQTSQDILELLDSMGRHTVPIYHTDNWYALRISQVSQTLTTDANVIRYDTDLVYDGGATYDTPAMARRFSHTLPAALVEIPLIMNNFVSPEIIWAADTHYSYTANSILFFTDPFADPRIVKQLVYKDGVVVDTIATLWVYRGKWDWDTIYQQYGYVLQLRMQSSAGYRDVLNAVYTAMLNGGAGGNLKQMLSAMTGIPLVRNATETVVEITADSGGQLIITDKAAYRLPVVAEVNVTVGDTVTGGESLTTALQVYELNRRGIIADIPALSLGTGYLASCMYSDLLFANKDVALEVIEDDPSGFTKLRWPLGGFPLDVDKFFDDLHARGVEAALQNTDTCDESELLEHTGGITEYDSVAISSYVRKATLAHLLDTREAAIDEPTVANLPTTINPYRFLIDNVLHKNTTIVILRTAGFSTAGIGLQNLSILRRILPPQHAVIILLEVAIATDSLDNSNFSESLASWTGVTPQEDIITTTHIQDYGLTARVVYGV